MSILYGMALIVTYAVLGVVGLALAVVLAVARANGGDPIRLARELEKRYQALRAANDGQPCPPSSLCGECRELTDRYQEAVNVVPPLIRVLGAVTEWVERLFRPVRGNRHER